MTVADPRQVELLLLLPVLPISISLPVPLLAKDLIYKMKHQNHQTFLFGLAEMPIELSLGVVVAQREQRWLIGSSGGSLGVVVAHG
jgi:hypothetical protein